MKNNKKSSKKTNKSKSINVRLTENEKKLLQAKHRLEEVQMRDRQKERKARTRRLIQEGAILEKALPQVQRMSLEQLEDFLWEIFKSVR